MMIRKINILIIIVLAPFYVIADPIFSIETIGEREPITSALSEFNPELDSYPDPFPSDQIILTIDVENYTAFKETLLTPGQIKMFETYPKTFKMNIYPSRRSCAVPPEVLELTKKNALLIDDGEGVEGVVGSIPFPNPSEALHHVWNHILRYRGVEIYGASPFYIINPDGTQTYGAGEAIAKNFWNPYVRNEEAGLQGMLMTKVTHPPRLADASTLVIESLNAFETPRKAWVYNPGTRRVRRAPDISYDYMPSAAQGLTTVDQVDGFNGAKDRYYWSDLGEQLRLMPYNAYKFHETNIEEILNPYHVNQELLRYELVKVNVVEAKLKEDKRHIIPKRIMYFDTDSHNMLSEETFDDMGLIMAYREFPIINFYDQPMCLSIHSATYDFATRRYQLQSVRSTDIPKVQWKLNEPHDERMFTPEGLKRFAR